MGILRGTARLLLEEHRRRPFSGSVLQLGKSFVFFGRDEFADWAGLHGVQLAGDVPLEPSHAPELAATGCLSDDSFFRLLGFDEVASSDANRWEGADLIVDLNQPIPAELVGRFDAVFEAGTLQHVFDVRQALCNIYDLLRVGGRVIHGLAPASNHVDHGFYSFSPTLFHDFYSENGFQIEAIHLICFLPFWIEGRLDSAQWDVHEYDLGCLDHLSYGRFGNRQAGVFIVATRTEESTGDRIPQQSYFRRLWEASGGTESGDTESAADRPPASRPWPPPSVFPSGRPSLRYRLLRPLKALREISRRIGPKRLPPRVARY